MAVESFYYCSNDFNYIRTSDNTSIYMYITVE